MNNTRALYLARLELEVRQLEAASPQAPGELPVAERLAHNRRLRQARLRLARAKGTHTREQWEAIVAETGGICVKCGYQHMLPHERPGKGHFLPVALGGSEAIENLMPLCRRCISGVNDATNWLAEWRKARDEGVAP